MPLHYRVELEFRNGLDEGNVEDFGRHAIADNADIEWGRHGGMGFAGVVGLVLLVFTVVDLFLACVYVEASEERGRRGGKRNMDQKP